PSGPWSSSPTGRLVPERGGRVPERAARHGEDADAKRPAPPRGPAGGRARVSGSPDFRELVGEDLPADETELLHRVHELLVAAGEAAGNWPMKFTVQGLPKPPLGGYYELYLTRHGRIAAACGTFNVHAGKTTVTLNAPYELKGYDGWVVIGHVPGQRESTQP